MTTSTRKVFTAGEMITAADFNRFVQRDEIKPAPVESPAISTIAATAAVAAASSRKIPRRWLLGFWGADASRP